MAVVAVPEPAAGSLNPVALLASAVRTASGTGPEVELRGSAREIVFEAVLSAVSGGLAVTVYVQQSFDGVNWDDLWTVALPASGPDTPEVHQAVFQIGERGQVAPLSHMWTDGVMAVGVRTTPIGRLFRAKWSLVAGSYTFQVLAHLR